ncbi:hypothetical protein [Methylobacterium sp. 285MFTsu5.1]|uniref:hypothetical protein n=1 Tax=Methylobacterium sp. 285MFTsu5.1 TaxID=1172187 RepID=UPI001319D706|nr:hypothetical protein [Methylobacterium sp. 285MFTsu5.1]
MSLNLASSVDRHSGGSGDCAMSKQSARVGKAIVATLHNSICRRIRFANERITMARSLEIVATSRPDVVSVVPRGLEDIPSYVRLADDGLAHATLRRVGGTVIVLAATNRVWRKPKLRKRLLSVKRDARRIGRRVLLVTKRGLARQIEKGLSRSARPAASSSEAANQIDQCAETLEGP